MFQFCSFRLSRCLHLITTSFALSICVLSFTAVAQELSPSPFSLPDSVTEGYGVQKKIPLTGSATTINKERFNQGLVISPEQLITGQVAGFQVTGLSGAPGAGNFTRLQRASALPGENTPLIVLDGVFLEDEHLHSIHSISSLLNPNDIASITVLKDAAATGIYGSRGVHGVVLITTKRGLPSQKFHIDVHSQAAVSSLRRKVDVFTADEFRKAVRQWGNQQQQSLLGTANTDWQNEIYESSFSHGQNISASGTVGILPYRLSLGYLDQQGIITNSHFKRKSVALTLNPSFFNQHLKVEVSLKGMEGKTRFANDQILSYALSFDPTQPVDANSLLNPKRILEHNHENGDVTRLFGNARIDYSFHFFPALHAVLNLGYDELKGERINQYPSSSSNAFFRDHYDQNRTNQQKEAFLKYQNTFETINTSIEVTVGVTQQVIKGSDTENRFQLLQNQTTQTYRAFSSQDFSQPAGFLNLNIGYKNRYFLTTSARQDGSSWFGEENRWFLSKAFGLGWRISEEDFMKGFGGLNELKLRISYGIQGNGKLPSFNPTSTINRPDLKHETVKTANLGIDFGFLDNKLHGSLDIYRRKTEDLFIGIPIPSQGGNFTNILLNRGELMNKGMEGAINYQLSAAKFSWTVGLTASYSLEEITSTGPNKESLIIHHPQFLFGSTIMQVGQPLNTLNLYQQLYDADGYPLEGQYADINKDKRINSEDRYTKLTISKTIIGLSSNFSYLRWNLNFMAYAHLGNNVYNINEALRGNLEGLNSTTTLTNISSSILKTRFVTSQYGSDVYAEEAAFLRVEYISLGYDFGKVLQNKVTLKLAATAQNALVFTKYSGQDPEVANGIDYSHYPRPRVFSLKLEVGFW